MHTSPSVTHGEPRPEQRQLEFTFRRGRGRSTQVRADDQYVGLAVRSRTEVAEIMHISRQRVAAIEASALRKLRILFTN